MTLSQRQLELWADYELDFDDQLNQFESAPEELRVILQTVWDKLESTVELEDNSEANLAIVSALVQLRELSNEFQPEDISTLLDLFIGLVLAKHN